MFVGIDVWPAATGYAEMPARTMPSCLSVMLHVCSHGVCGGLYVYQSLSETCDTAKEQRFNRLDGTYYFTENELPKSCTSAQRTRLLELCRPAEKLPGLAVSHWPWQGQSLNRNKLGFSGDSLLLGPYGFSGRAGAVSAWVQRDCMHGLFRFMCARMHKRHMHDKDACFAVG